MRCHTAVSFVVICLLTGIVALTACSDPDDPEVTINHGEDAGVDVDPEVDAGPEPDADEDADVVDEPLGGYCEVCSEDADCEDGHCLELRDGERACGIDCDPDDEAPCPDGAYCYVVDDDGNTQCAPNVLSCDDPCEDVVCPEGEHCDPFDAECVAEPRICDTGCQLDAECGDPAENVCLSTGAPDGETMCTTRCDPNVSGEEQDLECPSDFVCAPLEEDGDEGVCFPLARTCIDRCADVECGGGYNCDPFTGDCVEAEFGACEPGCEINADCEGQDDWCLNLGFGDDAHCWLDCTADGACPDGYECTPLLGFTSRLCLPPTQQCAECYDADCYPDGICDPTTGECMPHPEDCTEVGCDDDQICEPVSKRCVDIDGACRGESWAVDCDNVVTRCTSQRPDTEGICAVICSDDTDCPDSRSCTATEFGDLCLGPDFGGATTCGTLTEPGADLGQPCGDDADSCESGFECIETGGMPGFCSTDCTDDADCPGDATCGVGPGGDAVCLPPQCQCAGSPALPGELEDGWESALDELELTACDIAIPTGVVRDTSPYDELTAVDQNLETLLSMPAAGLGTLRSYVDDLDEHADVPALLLAETITILDVEPAEPAGTTPATPDLLDALSDLAETAGGSLDESAAENELDDVPQQVQQLASGLIVAIDDAYAARNQALDDADIDPTIRQELFDKTHRLLLPHADTEDALDVSDPDIAAAIDDFPLSEFTEIAAELASSVDAAIDDADIDPGDVPGEFSAVIDTPAGKVVIGDATDNTYDAADDPEVDGPLALVLEIGGDNTYRLPVAANQSVDNAVSILVDLDGSDTYSYPKTGDPLDGDLLMESDDAGRKDPAGDDAIDGPVSLSETARQGAGRLGIGMLFDRGGEDTYETLRMGQGAGILGVGAVFDTGEEISSFEAEAFAQGAGLRGVGLLYSEGGDNTYRIWHAGQGFGSALGVGVLFDRTGSDDYTAVVGDDDEEVLYHSSADAGSANRSLAQGASSSAGELAGGIGVLRDVEGDDTYTAASYAQGFGEFFGAGVLADATGGDDYQGRASIQGTGRDAGMGAVFDDGGDDEFNQRSSPQNLGQGTGDAFGWGALVVVGGENELAYSTPGGGIALDGGFGFSLFDGGPNDHDAGFGGGLGLASFNADDDSPFATGLTGAVFVQTGGEDDTYSHPLSDDLDIENNAIWRQDAEDVDHALGVGVDE